MAYNKEEWMAIKATTVEKIRPKIMKLPDRGPVITEYDPEFSIMGQRMISQPSTSTTRTGKARAG